MSELTPRGNSFTSVNITLAAPTTTVIKSTPGVLHTITFNKPVATGVITVYDNGAASGTVIATITIPANPQPFTLTYDRGFENGLTIVTATAAQDITVSYI
jgi:hypothetical protein